MKHRVALGYRVHAALVLAVTLLVATQAPAQQKSFGPAESLAFQCRYLGMTIGKANILVGGPTLMGDQTVWPIVGLGKTESFFILYPIKDRYVTWWNPEQHLAIASELTADEKNKRRREQIRFDRQAKSAVTVRQKEGEQKSEDTYSISPNAQDMLGAIFWLREKRLAVGDHEEITVFTGRREFTLKADVDRKETVEVPAGKFDTVVLRVQVQFAGKLASKRDVRLYLSDDPRHIPVRIDAEFVLGSVIADLVGYQKGIL